VISAFLSWVEAFIFEFSIRFVNLVSRVEHLAGSYGIVFNVLVKDGAIAQECFDITRLSLLLVDSHFVFLIHLKELLCINCSMDLNRIFMSTLGVYSCWNLIAIELINVISEIVSLLTIHLILCLYLILSLYLLPSLFVLYLDFCGYQSLLNINVDKVVLDCDTLLKVFLQFSPESFHMLFL